MQVDVARQGGPMEELRNQIYKRIGGDEQQHDMHTFNILMAIDGKRSVETIAKEDHYEIGDLSRVLEQLVITGAIAPVEVEYSDSMRDVFFTQLEDELSRIMGPVSSIIVQENVGQLGSDRTNFPMNRAGELVQLISRNIPDNHQQQAFVNRMTEVLSG